MGSVRVIGIFMPTRKSTIVMQLNDEIKSKYLELTPNITFNGNSSGRVKVMPPSKTSFLVFLDDKDLIHDSTPRNLDQLIHGSVSNEPWSYFQALIADAVKTFDSSLFEFYFSLSLKLSGIVVQFIGVAILVSKYWFEELSGDELKVSESVSLLNNKLNTSNIIMGRNVEIIDVLSEQIELHAIDQNILTAVRNSLKRGKEPDIMKMNVIKFINFTELRNAKLGSGDIVHQINTLPSRHSLLAIVVHPYFYTADIISGMSDLVMYHKVANVQLTELVSKSGSLADLLSVLRNSLLDKIKQLSDLIRSDNSSTVLIIPHHDIFPNDLPFNVVIRGGICPKTSAIMEKSITDKTVLKIYNNMRIHIMSKDYPVYLATDAKDCAAAMKLLLHIPNNSDDAEIVS